jgi:antitoxin (DNA-binding transcriptional repressor) of toxin-antitoxin stability system
MKTISIKQLHARTGYWARIATKTPLIITDRGEQIASLQPVPASVAARSVLKNRDWSKLPSSDLDSTVFISEDRDAR